MQYSEHKIIYKNRASNHHLTNYYPKQCQQLSTDLALQSISTHFLTTFLGMKKYMKLTKQSPKKPLGLKDAEKKQQQSSLTVQLII